MYTDKEAAYKISVTMQTDEENTHERDANTIALHFDRLFPQTPFEMMFDASVQLYQFCQEFEYVCKTKSCDPCFEPDFDLFTDVLVGKLFGIKMSVGKIACQMPRAHQEDIGYLSKLFDDLLCDYKTTCSVFMDKPKSGYVGHLIGDIQSKLAGVKVSF